MTDAGVAGFVRGRTPDASAITRWGRAGIELAVSSYLSRDAPPVVLVTSVRAVVVKSGRVVVLENRDGKHYLPGGRIEPGEDHLEALSREVNEECGLQVVDPEQIGFIHFHHRTPRPDQYPYPYPDMIHRVFVAEGRGELSCGDVDGYEVAAELMSPEAAAALEHTGFALPFLHRALARRSE